jgi:hypothetical protein
LTTECLQYLLPFENFLVWYSDPHFTSNDTKQLIKIWSFSGKMVESKKALPKETRPSFYGSYGPPFTPVAAAAAMAMAAAHAARQGNFTKDTFLQLFCARPWSYQL